MRELFAHEEDAVEERLADVKIDVVGGGDVHGLVAGRENGRCPRNPCDGVPVRSEKSEVLGLE